MSSTCFKACYDYIEFRCHNMNKCNKTSAFHILKQHYTKFSFIYIFSLTKSSKPEPVSPLTRISLNVQTKAQLKISRIRNQSNPQNTKNTTKFGPKSPHLNRTLENKLWENKQKRRKEKRRQPSKTPSFFFFLSPFFVFLLVDTFLPQMTLRFFFFFHFFQFYNNKQVVFFCCKNRPFTFKMMQNMKKFIILFKKNN